MPQRIVGCRDSLVGPAKLALVTLVCVADQHARVLWEYGIVHRHQHTGTGTNVRRVVVVAEAKPERLQSILKPKQKQAHAGGGGPSS
jgi:hypothetical protein